MSRIASHEERERQAMDMIGFNGYKLHCYECGGEGLMVSSIRHAENCATGQILRNAPARKSG